MSDPKILVTGGTGLVGNAIIRKLLEKGYKHIVTTYHTRSPVNIPEGVERYQVDLRKQKDTEDFIEHIKPDWVFLAAAKVGGILANNIYKAEFIYDNLAIAFNVIHASYKAKVKKLLNLGSSCIYPKNCPQPMKEEYLLTGSLEPTNEPYAIAKIAAIKLCRYYNEQYGTNFISVMPTNLYGPWDNFNLETAHVLPALIRKFHLAKLLRKGKYDEIAKDIKRSPLGFGLDEKVDVTSSESIKAVLAELGVTSEYVTIWGSGEVYREFLYVDDLAGASIYLMENVDANSIQKLCLDCFVNVGVGEDIKIKDLALLIKDIVGFNGGLRFDLSKPDGVSKKLLDVSKITQLGWKYQVSLEKGIWKIYKWYIESM